MMTVLNFLDKLWLLDPSPSTGKIRDNISVILDQFLECNKKKHGNIQHNIRRIREKLNRIRSQPSWSDHEESKLEIDLERMLAIEEDYWKTRSRADWLMEGDRNTTVFHHKVTRCQKRNSITLFKGTNGMNITDPLEIEQVVLLYFQSNILLII